MYIHIHICIYVCIYIYVYMYVYKYQVLVSVLISTTRLLMVEIYPKKVFIFPLTVFQRMGIISGVITSYQMVMIMRRKLMILYNENEENVSFFKHHY